MRDVSVVFIFAECPPDELLELKRFGYLLASTAECHGVEKVADVEAYVRDKFAIVVGDAGLAKRLDVGHMAWDEALDFLELIRYQDHIEGYIPKFKARHA